MQDVNLLSHCFMVQWKLNLRSGPAFAGRGRGSTNRQPRGESVADLGRMILPSVQRLEPT